jgi:serine/threonine protein kinase
VHAITSSWSLFTTCTGITWVRSHPQRASGTMDRFRVFSAYLGMCYQVALGIEHMHARGVVHLNLKESNVPLEGGMGRSWWRILGSAPAKALSNSSHGALRGSQPLASCKLVVRGVQAIVQGPLWTSTAPGRCFSPSCAVPHLPARETGTQSSPRGRLLRPHRCRSQRGQGRRSPQSR